MEVLKPRTLSAIALHRYDREPMVAGDFGGTGNLGLLRSFEQSQEGIVGWLRKCGSLSQGESRFHYRDFMMTGKTRFSPLITECPFW